MAKRNPPTNPRTLDVERQAERQLPPMECVAMIKRWADKRGKALSNDRKLKINLACEVIAKSID